jgi:hypothetical protein
MNGLEKKIACMSRESREAAPVAKAYLNAMLLSVISLHSIP